MAALISAAGNCKGVVVTITNSTTGEDRLAKLGKHGKRQITSDRAIYHR